jgi:hypothetical protein
MIVAGRRRARTRVAMTGADKGDRARDDGAKKRQEDNGFVHAA